eukprot:TRINITY_DN7364_c0_g1_i1.p1 TRINITY_DN7364_c0_g1~~TRINITY_DN7364_c0_g1_i1.p1  ORF type:complete len:398 (-),score=119.75 TRINITY_DN7364_c0_g1_i1:146-1339(-)
MSEPPSRRRGGVGVFSSSMASGGVVPKRVPRRYPTEVDYHSAYLKTRSTHLPMRRDEVRQLRSSLARLENRVSDFLGVPNELHEELEDDDDPLEEELHEIRESILQMDSRLCELLDEPPPRARRPQAEEREESRLHVLSQSMNQCLRGLSELSSDVNQLRVSLRGTVGRTPLHPRVVEGETLLMPGRLNNQSGATLGRRPNNYWDNCRSFCRKNPVGGENPLHNRRVKSKINRENNVSRKKRPTRIPVNVNLQEEDSFKKPIPVSKAILPSEEEEDEEFKSVSEERVLLPRGTQHAGEGQSDREQSAMNHLESEMPSLRLMQHNDEDTSVNNSNSNHHSNAKSTKSDSAKSDPELDWLLDEGSCCHEDEESFQIDNFLSHCDNENENYQSHESEDQA